MKHAIDSISIDPASDPIFVMDLEGLEALRDAPVEFLDRDLDKYSPEALFDAFEDDPARYAPYLILNPEVLGEFREVPSETYCVKDAEGDWWVSLAPESGYTTEPKHVERGHTDLDDVTGVYGIDAGEPAPLKVGDVVSGDDYGRLPNGTLCTGEGWVPVFKDDRGVWQALNGFGHSYGLDPRVADRTVVRLGY